MKGIEQNLPFEIEEVNTEKQQEPVICLGREFESDEARREYFREELRRRLPELRQIEGFPIGEDEDIIRLSDPPYYTACPNPWLNEFIAEWEREKEQLLAEGKRTADFEVKEPYAYGVKQGKNSAIYNAHTYHTKVPHEVIMRYILHYTQPGDIILDGFAGTGMTGVASTLCKNSNDDAANDITREFNEYGYDKPNWGKRRAICGDISPLCFHISSNYNSSVNIKSLNAAIQEILADLKERFGEFYEYKISDGKHEIKGHINYFVWSEIVGCNNCGHELNVHDLLFDYKTKELHEALTCPNCGTAQKRVKAVPIRETIFDEDIKESVSQIKYECCLLNYSIPKRGRYFSRNIPVNVFPPFEGYIPLHILQSGDKFGDPQRVGANHVNQLYFKRTKYVLAYLYDLINHKYRELSKPLMFIYTSMLPKLTRMNRYMPQHGSRALVGPMANTLYIPPQSVENNPIDQFEYQAGKVLRAFEFCRSGNAIQICSATNSSLGNDSVDYIFTDPPFGSNIMYSELNCVSESWLKLLTNNSEEAISNNTQHKGLPEYQAIMTRCFREYFRVLKPGKWMTVEFSNTSAAFWNCLQYSIANSGFIISAITDLNKERGGLHAMLGPTAVKQDLAITCYKPTTTLTEKMERSGDTAENVWDFVGELLEHLPVHLVKENKTTAIVERSAKILFDRMIAYYVQHGYPVPMDAQEFQAGLRDRFVQRDGMFFTAEQAMEYDEKKREAPEFQELSLFVDSEQNGIGWLKNELRDAPQTYQDLQPKWMQALQSGKKGDAMPELRDLLQENFIEDEGVWRLPDPEKEADLDKLRTRKLLREFAHYAEQARLPRSKKMKDARLEALRAGFKQCYKDKDFQTILLVGDKIPETLLTEDDVLLQYYDIAASRS